MSTTESPATIADQAATTVQADTDWETVIGLEVHTELRTRTKLFCGCANQFGEEPNVNVCPVCLGLPGSLPVLNRQAVEYAMRIGAALHCTIQDSKFHRKNYFYPDMPKDYQISQYDVAINENGYLDLPDGTRIGVERAHIEEDTGKSTHVGGSGRIHGADHSLVDYNRAGVPLVEIVSRPDMRSAEQAKAYVEELRGILVASGASDGRMEEGSLRVDANVSVRPRGAAEFGTRCEIKNLNSIRSLGRAIIYEAQRQIKLITEGGAVIQQTRHWDEDAGVTSAMRSKEEANDYRYFPEPDLVPLNPSPEWIAEVRSSLPELPAAERAWIAEVTGQPADSDAVLTLQHLGLVDYLRAVAEGGADPELALKRLANEVAAQTETLDNLSQDAFVSLLKMETAGSLTSSQARTVLKELLEAGGDPAAIAKAHGFEALAAGQLDALVDQVIAGNPAEWERFKAGEDKLQGLFMGKLKAASGGKADLKAAGALLRSRRG